MGLLRRSWGPDLEESGGVQYGTMSLYRVELREGRGGIVAEIKVGDRGFVGGRAVSVIRGRDCFRVRIRRCPVLAAEWAYGKIWLV